MLLEDQLSKLQISSRLKPAVHSAARLTFFSMVKWRPLRNWRFMKRNLLLQCRDSFEKDAERFPVQER